MATCVSSAACMVLALVTGFALCLGERSFSTQDLGSRLGGRDAHPEVPFRIVRVEKTDKGESARLRVLFQASSTPHIFIGERNRGRVHHIEPGVVELDVPKDRLTSAFFVFAEHYTIAFFAPMENKTSMDIPAVDFNIAQGHDIRFKPGQDVELDFAFDAEGEHGYVNPEELDYRLLIPSRRQKHVIESYSSTFVERNPDKSPVRLDMITSGGSELHRHGRLVLKSDIGEVEGIVDISVNIRYNCTTNCLLYRLKETLSLQIYREGHTSPFPEDFVGFIHEDMGINSSHTSCSINSSDCNILCQVFGEGLVGVEITKTTQSPDKPLQSVSRIVNNWGQSLLHVPDVSFQDAGTFVCRAWTEEKEISEQQTLGVVQKALIDRQVSVVTTFSNGSLLFTCLAEGIPTPDVTLFDYLSGRPTRVNQTHVTHPSQSQTRVDLLVNGPRPLSHSGSYGLYCFAVNADSEEAVTSFGDILYYYPDH